MLKAYAFNTFFIIFILFLSSRGNEGSQQTKKKPIKAYSLSLRRSLKDAYSMTNITIQQTIIMQQQLHKNNTSCHAELVTEPSRSAASQHNLSLRAKSRSQHPIIHRSSPHSIFYFLFSFFFSTLKKLCFYVFQFNFTKQIRNSILKT